MAPPFLPELKRAGGRRSFDYEAAAAAAAAAAKVLAGKSASSSSCHTAASTSSSGEKVPVVAPTSHRTGALLINGWQEAAIDLTKSSGEISTTSGIGTNEAVVAPGTSHHSAGAGSSHKLPPPPPITAPLQGSVGIDMAGILQAGLIHPVTGQIVNGSLRGDDSLRRRRGRRRNVEALYSEFTKSRGLHLPETQVGRGRRAFQREGRYDCYMCIRVRVRETSPRAFGVKQSDWVWGENVKKSPCVWFSPSTGPSGGDQPLLCLLLHLLAIPLSLRTTCRPSYAVLLFYPHAHPDASSARDRGHRQRGGQQRSDRVAETESWLQHGSSRVRSRKSEGLCHGCFCVS